jgi:lysophospholipase L1-like esterase
MATAGHAVADRYATIDTDLVAYTEVPDVVLLNFGVNDGAATEEDWKAQYGYILDQMHARWPNATLYVARWWSRGATARANTSAGWVADIVAARSGWCHLGIDERIFLENGDDGVTYTSDGTHPNAAGYELTATKWREVLDYA